MNINYETLTWLLLFINIAMFLYIMHVVKLVNDVNVLLGVKSKVIKESVDNLNEQMSYGIFKLTGDMETHDTNMTTKLNLLEADVGEIADELLGPIVVDDGDEEETEEIVVKIEEDPIHLIPKIQFFFENNGYDKFQLEYREHWGELRFYYGDGSGEYVVVDNVDECIGEGLKYFGVHPTDPDTVYIRNNVFKADFMIVRTVED